MPPIRVEPNEFRERFDTLRDLARSHPVVITENGADQLVVLFSREWERLRRSSRTVGLAADLPDQWLAAVESASVSSDLASLDRELDRIGSRS